jgi:hypothetical protein
MLNSVWSTLASFWEQLTPIDCSALSCAQFHNLDRLPTEIRDNVGNSYPPNHNFNIVDDCLVPSRKLATRVAHFRRYYVPGGSSLLDLSCSKGFFLFDAACDPTCERVLGIDLMDNTLETCKQLRRHFDYAERVAIQKLTLAELAERIEDFGGPFETVLLINTYQYLFFGSPIAPAVCQDHGEIFRLIRRVCSGRVIFHNRISYSRVQKHIRAAAGEQNWEQLYSPEAIRSAASKFFCVTELPTWAGHPIWLLDTPD